MSASWCILMSRTKGGESGSMCCCRDALHKTRTCAPKSRPLLSENEIKPCLARCRVGHTHTRERATFTKYLCIKIRDYMYLYAADCSSRPSRFHFRSSPFRFPSRTERTPLRLTNIKYKTTRENSLVVIACASGMKN